MERRLNQIVDEFNTNFKNDIKTFATTSNIIENQDVISLIQFICDYKRFKGFDKSDLCKRKRSVPNVQTNDQCCAKRSDGKQCSRRKKTGGDYCGTHLNKLPHGKITNDIVPVQKNTKVQVWNQDICGIVYNIDKELNVYLQEDILRGVVNPKIIAKCVVNDGVYSIPSFDV